MFKYATVFYVFSEIILISKARKNLESDIRIEESI